MIVMAVFLLHKLFKIINQIKNYKMENEVIVNQMPRIGDIAPDFEAVTTKGKLNFRIMHRENGK